LIRSLPLPVLIPAYLKINYFLDNLGSTSQIGRVVSGTTIHLSRTGRRSDGRL